MSTEPVQTALNAMLAGDLPKAEKLLLAAAESGSGHAAHELGILYSTGGPGVSRDAHKARAWLERSLASGFEATIATDPEWFRKGESET